MYYTSKNAIANENKSFSFSYIVPISHKHTRDIFLTVLKRVFL